VFIIYKSETDTCQAIFGSHSSCTVTQLAYHALMPLSLPNIELGELVFTYLKIP